MTIPRSARSLRRLSDSRIADTARWYALQWEKDLLPDEASLAAAALKIIHKTRRIDAKVKREIEAMAGRGAG